jgi:hypothetical protein
MDRENQNVLERIHNSVLEQFRTVERREKIFFHPGKILARNGIPRDEDDLHRLREFMLMQPETFAEQSPGTIALDGSADFLAGDDAQFWRSAFRQFAPIGDQTAKHQPFALLPDAREIAALLETRRAAQAQAFRRRGVHGIKPA